MVLRLVPRPAGYYAPVGARNEPTIEDDLAYLCDGDAFTIELGIGGYVYGGYSLRQEVLIVSEDESPREGV